MVALSAQLLFACGGPIPSEPPAPLSDSATGVPGIVFLTQSEGSGFAWQALYRGPLVVQGGCVLIGSPGDYSVPIWPKGFSAIRDESGRIIVRDGEGAVVVGEGGTFEMGGGYVVEFGTDGEVQPRVRLRRLEEQLGYAIPKPCLGPDVYGIWIVGET